MVVRVSARMNFGFAPPISPAAATAALEDFSPSMGLGGSFRLGFAAPGSPSRMTNAKEQWLQVTFATPRRSTWSGTAKASRQ
jgi:hypothetical protein